MSADALTALALTQQQMLSYLLQGSHSASPDAVLLVNESPARDALNQRGWQVYHANAAVLAERALNAAFPVLAQWLGTENFTPLSQLFWRAHPPQRGDLAQWGAALPLWMANQPQLTDQPFLADLARVEWALHQLASAADAVVDATSFQRLLTDEPDTLTLQLAPGVTCVESAWPVVTLWQAHDPQTAVTLADASQQLQQQQAETALVWRQGFKPQLRAAMAGECAWIVDLLAGRPLGPALTRHPNLDFDAWLPLAVSTGLLLGVSQAPLFVFRP